jgi:hypothetical protein
MSFANPTLLRIGMSATLAGRRYRVVGRVVMGMEEDGETYYWNEYNLVSDAGESATLVYEETEQGGQWRLFTMFEPEYPMTAADAATKRVGDPLNLNGTDVRVTLVDESRVYHIEGQAPEGVEMGDVARYFNAEAGDTMQVVSWTGDEVEYYRGMDLPRGAVASAFNLPNESTSGILSPPGSGSSWIGSDAKGYDSLPKFFLKAAALLIFAAVAFAVYSFRGPGIQPAATKKPASAAPLTLGSSGKLNGWNYHVTGHTVVEIAEVGLLYDRHEYQLLDDDGHPALLVCGWKPESDNWFLFTPVEPSMVLSSQQAGAKKLGDIVALDNLSAPVGELFQSTIRQLEPEPSPSPGVKKGDVFFGFTAQSSSALLLARWNAGGITFHRGKNLPAKDVTAAFNQPAGK